MKLFFIIFSLFHFSANAKIYVNIGAPQSVRKSLIALSPFVLKDLSQEWDKLAVGQKMSERLVKNLKFSGYFNILSPKAFIENPAHRSSVSYPKDQRGFRWVNWKSINVDFLFFADYLFEGDRLVLTISLHNINAQKTLFRKKYRGGIDQAERLVDRLSNDIVYALSRKKGVFETKILSIRDISPGKRELFVMDWDGQRQKRLSFHHSIALSPVWSHDGRQAAYSAFVYSKKLKRRTTALFLYDFKAHKIRLLSVGKGSSLGSDFLLNKRQMLVTLGSGTGLMDIFKLNLKSRSLVPLTKGPWGIINVEPRVHPRTGRIVFSSDRAGKTMIYVMGPRGDGLRRVTFAGSHNATPDWHPVKDEIVFSGLSRGRMDLFRISANRSGLKRLTSLKKANGRWANCESPSFSPDGRFIVFSSNVSGLYQLYVMNLDDLSIERITFDRYNYKSPRWSPYL